MADEKTRAETDRRGFLKMAGIGGLAGSAAIMTGKPAEAAGTDEAAARSGYAETDHVKTFYRTARF